MTAPPLDRPTVDDVLPLVCAYTAQRGEPGGVNYPPFEMGGALHIVLDDGNLRRGHIRWCRDHASQHGDAAGAMLADVLLTLSMSQLRRLYHRYSDVCSYREIAAGVGLAPCPFAGGRCGRNIPRSDPCGRGQT